MSVSFLKKPLAVFAFAIAVAGVAHAGNPHFSDLSLSDEKDGEPYTTFSPDTETIFLHAGLVDVPAGTKVSSTWIAEDSNGVAPANYKIDSVDLVVSPPINVATFSLGKPNKGFPEGTYRVDLFIAGQASGEVHFKVEK